MKDDDAVFYLVGALSGLAFAFADRRRPPRPLLLIAVGTACGHWLKKEIEHSEEIDKTYKKIKFGHA